MEAHSHPTSFFHDAPSLPLPYISTDSLIVQGNASYSYEDLDFEYESLFFFIDNDGDVLPETFNHKRKRQRPSRGKVFPRIIKNDIRRYYGQMLFNVMNSHNEKTIDAFLDRYALPCVTLTKHVDHQDITVSRLSHPSVRKDVDDVSPNTMEIAVKGRANISRYWQLLHSLVPDEVLRVTNIRISRTVHRGIDPNTGNVRLVGHETTRVICEWDGQGTQVYEGPPPCLFAYTVLEGTLLKGISDGGIDSEPSLSSSVSLLPSTKKRRLEETYDDLRHSRGPSMFPLPRRSASFEFQLRGQLIMEVDAECRLQTIDFGTVKCWQ